MKQGLGQRLEALSVLLSYAQPEMLERLVAASDLFKTSSSASLGQLTKALDALRPEAIEETTSVTGGEIAAALSTVLAIAEQVDGKKAITNGLAALRDALSAPHLQNVGITAILAGLRSPPKKEGGGRAKTAKTAEAVREDVVAEYISGLEAALGHSSFEPLYDRLTKDRRVRGVEAAAIASKFVSETGKNAKKSESLERIRSRHDNVVDSKQKDRVLTASNHGR